MRKAGDIVADLFKHHFEPGFIETARSTSGLFSSWSAVVAELFPNQGTVSTALDSEEDDIPAAAVHSRIRNLDRGLLLVEVDHPGWIQLLQTKQAGLLLALQRRYPDLDIRSIAFRLSREPTFGSLAAGNK